MGRFTRPGVRDRSSLCVYRCTIRVPWAVRWTTGASAAAWAIPLSRRREEWIRYASHAKLNAHSATCDRS